MSFRKCARDVLSLVLILSKKIVWHNKWQTVSTNFVVVACQVKELHRH